MCEKGKIPKADFDALAMTVFSSTFGYTFLNASFGKELSKVEKDAYIKNSVNMFIKGLKQHEQGLVHAADGYARSTGKVGVCLVTSGPGATNLVTGIATANYDSVPLVCFTGQVPTQLIGKDAFQEVDTVSIKQILLTTFFRMP